MLATRRVPAQSVRIPGEERREESDEGGGHADQKRS